MDNSKQITIRFPVPQEAYAELVKCDMLVIPASFEEIEFARQAFGALQRSSCENAAETIGYLSAFFNRAIHVQKPNQGRLQ